MSANIRNLRLLSKVKQFLVSKSARIPRKCHFGLFRSLVFDLDLNSQTQVWLGLWERETYSFIRRAAKNCQWAVDVGAGLGELCVYLSKKSHIEKIYAIDPNSFATDILSKNLALNGVENTCQIRILNNLVGTSQDPDFVALDALDLDRSKPGFIKIDVDGPECDVLDSGRSLLKEAYVYILVETHSQDLEKLCIERLEQQDFSCMIVRNAWWRIFIPELRPIAHNRWLWAVKRTKMGDVDS